MRGYYKDDWHCKCDPKEHTLENYIKGLENIFGDEYTKIHVTSDEKYIHVDTDNECVLAQKIFEAEFHGLILSSIHSRRKGNSSEIGLLFKYPRQIVEEENNVTL